MNYITISVPNLNDSVSSIVIDGEKYFVRFAYNDTGSYWMFSLQNEDHEFIFRGIKMVPYLSLTLFVGLDNIPKGSFIVVTDLERIVRNSFVDGKAQFLYVPLQN